MMTTSMPTISLVGKLKAESVGELAKVTLQENTSSNIPTQFPNPAQGTHTNRGCPMDQLYLLLSIVSPTSAA